MFKNKKNFLSKCLVFNVLLTSFFGFSQTTTTNAIKVLDHNLIQNDDLETYGTGWVSNPIFKLGDVKFTKSHQDDYLTTTLNTGSLFLSLQLTNVSVVNSYLKKHNNCATLDQMMDDSFSFDHPGQKLINSIEIGLYNPDNTQFQANLKGQIPCYIHTKRDVSGKKLVNFDLDNNYSYVPFSLNLSQDDYVQDIGSKNLGQYDDDPYYDTITHTFTEFPMSTNAVMLLASSEIHNVDLKKFYFYKDLGNVQQKTPAQYKLTNLNSITFETSFNLLDSYGDYYDGSHSDEGVIDFYENSIQSSAIFPSENMLSDLDYPNISKIEYASERDISSINVSDSYKIFPSDLNFYNIFNELMPEYDKNIWLLSANLSNRDRLVLQPDDIVCTGKIEQGFTMNDWTDNYLLDEWNPEVIEKIQNSNLENGTVPDYISISQNWEYRVGGRHPVEGWIYTYRQKESFTLKFKYINAIGEREFPITNPNSKIKPSFEFYKTDLPYSN